jgi:hypothetical protein
MIELLEVIFPNQLYKMEKEDARVKDNGVMPLIVK